MANRQYVKITLKINIFMKRKIKISISALVLFGALFFIQDSKATPLSFDNLECKVEVFLCKGITTKQTRTICHEHGDGLRCVDCGDSTKCKDTPIQE